VRDASYRKSIEIQKRKAMKTNAKRKYPLFLISGVAALSCMIFISLTLALVPVKRNSTFTFPGSAGNGSVGGTVVMTGSGDPVAGATVALNRQKRLIATVTSDQAGNFSFNRVPSGTYSLNVTKSGFREYVKTNMIIGDSDQVMVTLWLTPIASSVKKDEKSKILGGIPATGVASRAEGKISFEKGLASASAPCMEMSQDMTYIDFNTESYDKINENSFKNVADDPLSTFSIDVDKASYSNVRRFLNGNTMPYKDAVRIEELINYFNYDYPQPSAGVPFSVSLESGDCPWKKEHKLVLIGIKGKELQGNQVPQSNLVFLIDVSGSMNEPNKLPLIKQSFRILVNNLRPADRIAMVVYAGAAGVILESTPGTEKEKILAALDLLEAGGSTAGGAGITLAYRIAKQNYIRGGNNRVILATDGDFNIGASSDGEMTRLIEEKRNDGIFLSILGFGMGNYKDSKMEKIADAGNGNYAYIDNIMEAKKVFGEELSGTLFTIAKDVKIQVEFNPAKVKAYRLIGYENRMLNKEDFNDDKKDAGEIGAGHTVTALYEIVPAGSDEQFSTVDPLEYQKPKITGEPGVMTIKLRYKEPDDSVSKLIVRRLADTDLKSQNQNDNFRFASAVAEFGMLLRDSGNKGSSSYADVISLASASRGTDKYGYRQEFIRLAETASLLAKK
jgi:Ca-activated chloride channel homolog